MHHRDKISPIESSRQLQTGRAASKKIQRFCLNSGLRDVELRLRLFEVMVTPIITYANPCWSPDVIPRHFGRYNKGKLRMMELIHQGYLRFALGANGFSPIISLYLLSGKLPIVVFLL